jgi:putative zinc finger/helix-turn-helix YgiT family protein
MKCIMCGSQKMKSKHGIYRYDMGLDEKIPLLNVVLRQCPDCGEEEVIIPQLSKLYHVVAKALAEKRARLTPKEITFLRTHINLDNEQFARIMGVSVEHARRWQRSKGSPMPIMAERLLRILILGKGDITSISQFATQAPAPFHPKMRPVNKQWKALKVAV